MATLIEMRVRVGNRLDQALVGGDIPESGVFWTRAEVNEWINSGRRQVYAEIAEIEGPTLATETVGTYTASARTVAISGTDGVAGGLLNLTAAPLKILGVHDITQNASLMGVEIPLRPYNEVARTQGDSGRFNRTAAWWGSNPMNLAIGPVPSSALSLRIRYIPAAPADLTDVSLATNTPHELPSVHHDLLVLYAVVQAKKKEEDASWQDDWATYRELLDRMKNNIEERNAANSRQVVISDPGDYGDSSSQRFW